MKVKSFKEHLEKRLNAEEIAHIEQAAQIEFETLKALQNDVSSALQNYMAKNKMGFNALARQLGKSQSQVSKILKGEANLTLATVAQVFALMGQKVRFKSL